MRAQEPRRTLTALHAALHASPSGGRQRRSPRARRADPTGRSCDCRARRCRRCDARYRAGAESASQLRATVPQRHRVLVVRSATGLSMGLNAGHRCRSRSVSTKLSFSLVLLVQVSQKDASVCGDAARCGGPLIPQWELALLVRWQTLTPRKFRALQRPETAHGGRAGGMSRARTARARA